MAQMVAGRGGGCAGHVVSCRLLVGFELHRKGLILVELADGFTVDWGMAVTAPVLTLLVFLLPSTLS